MTAMLVRLYGPMVKAAGSKELNLDCRVLELRELLTMLVNKYPGLNEYIVIKDGEILLRGVTILINGRHAMFQGGFKAEIHGGDVVDIIPPVRGGYPSANSTRFPGSTSPFRVTIQALGN